MSSSQKTIDYWIDKLVPSMEKKLYKLYNGRKAKRFFHPKMHGCVRAEFIVKDNLSSDLRMGVFSVSKTYPAWIRFSNSSHRIKSDAKKNFHGMAIKLMDVKGKKMLKEQENAETQDFILVNSPVLNTKSLKNAAQAVLALNGNIFVKIWFLITHIGELIGTLRKSPNTNLLHSKYFSQVPISFGEGKAIKFSTIPRDTNDPDNHEGPDYLRETMIQELAKNDIWFDFAVQFQEDPSTMPIEDPSIEWTSPFKKVASIRIPKQEFHTKVQFLFGEHLSFNPWHGIRDHKPLGKINTARGDIYTMLSKFRHNQNGIKVFEPTSSTKPEIIYSDDLKASPDSGLFPSGLKIYQSQFTAIIPLKAGVAKDLNDCLKRLGKFPETEESIFSRLRTAHYCRFFLIDKAENPDHSKVPPQLVFSAVFDGKLDMFLEELFEELRQEVEKIFAYCIGYPSGQGQDLKKKLRWLKDHRNKEKLFWPAKKGGTVSMIRNESILQRRIQDFLDKTYLSEDLSNTAPKKVYDKIKDFVENQEDLKWALQPEPKASFMTKLLNILSLISVLVRVILLLPIFIIWAVMSLIFNKLDSKKYFKSQSNPSKSEIRSLKEILEMEDKFYQNQLTIYATIKKPLWFRATYLKLFLFIANNKMRFLSTQGSLGGITSIHFVSWSLFNNSKNGMFLSNYDNGWQSYLSEFIDKAANVMNLSFGNLAGYPPIKFFWGEGANDEQKFKEIVRKYQFLCPVWYSAYPEISTSNVIINSKIRQGLSRKMSEEEIKKWLHLF